MPLTDHHRAMRALLADLEAEMRRRDLWSAQPPSPEAMSSVMPFMYDTLPLPQWLQWVFVPRTRALIDAGARLPGNCHIHPLAEHQFATLSDVDTTDLLVLIQQVDELMNQG